MSKELYDFMVIAIQREINLLKEYDYGTGCVARLARLGNLSKELKELMATLPELEPIK